MQIAAKTEGSVVVLALAGRLDQTTAAAFEASLKEALGLDRASLVVNLSGVDYINSAGLKSLLTAAKILRERSGRMTFTGISGVVRDVFTISQFDALFPSFPTEEEAIRHAAKPD